MRETDKVLGENLKKTKFACQVEAARIKLHQSEINIKAAKPGKNVELSKNKEKNEDSNKALFSEATIAKYSNRTNDDFER